MSATRDDDEKMNRRVVIAEFLQRMQMMYNPSVATLQRSASLLENFCDEKYSDDNFRFELGLVLFACECEHDERPLLEEQANLLQRLENEQIRARQRAYHGRLREIERTLKEYRERKSELLKTYYQRSEQTLH